VDFATYESLRPGQKVQVQATKALGSYFENLFTTSYQPSRKLDVTLVTGSAFCLSISMLFFLASVLPPRREKIVEPVGQNCRDSAITSFGIVPHEFAQPLPRRVKFKKKDLSLDWYEFFLPLPFLLIGSYLVLLAVLVGREGDILLCVMASIAALGWNALWLMVVCSLVMERWFIRRLYRCGSAVEGTIVSTSQKREKTSVKYCLECQYDHPGFGLRTIELRVNRREYVKTEKGRRVTVLCYPNLRWPRQVHEIGSRFVCY
jgi:hypothetical protein